MNFLKKFAPAALGLAFVLGASVAGANAQPGRARWEGNNGRHRGWEIGRHRGWERNNNRRWTSDRYYRDSYGNNYYYQRRSRNRYNRYNNSYGSSYILGGRYLRNNSRYYGSSYQNGDQRRRMWRRYQNERRMNYRRYNR